MHCQFYPGSPGYSEETPGTAMVLTCSKRHWDADDIYTATGLESKLLSATTCPDYELSFEAKQQSPPPEGGSWRTN